MKASWVLAQTEVLSSSPTVGPKLLVGGGRQQGVTNKARLCLEVATLGSLLTEYKKESVPR